MLKMPLVTFVITSYNYGRFITKTLESIKSQTYKNYEVIIVDDKSTDDSCGVIEKFIEQNQDIRITLIRHDDNQGQFAAMITGLKEARGQFVSFIDSDDILLKDYAESHLRVHMAVSAAFTSSQVIEIDEDDNIHTANSISSPQKGCSNAKKLDEILDVDVEKLDYEVLKNKRFGGWYWSPNSSAMFRKSAIDIITKYKNVDKWKICPDKFLFNFANLIGGSALIYEPLTAYRRHKENAGDGAMICGDKKLHSDKTTVINIKNNIKIRPETIRFLLQNRNYFGIRNTFQLIFKILF